MREDAVRYAKEDATKKAMDSLARQALETVQTETQNEFKSLETTIVFDGLTDFQTQYPLIEAGLKNLNFNVVRSNIVNTSKVIFLVSINTDRDIAGLTSDLLNAIPGFKPAEGGSGIGTSKIRLMFGGAK